MENIRRSAPREAQRIRNLRWIRDGIDGEPEFSAAMKLIDIAGEGYAGELVKQSWVVEGLNLTALESLGYMALSQPAALSNLMAHHTLADGITEQEAKALAVMHSTDDQTTQETLLEQANFEERTITLPLAGETRLIIVRTLPSTDYVMDFLEASVRDIEAYMGYPFPRRDVYLWFDTNGRTGGGYLGTHITIHDDEHSDEDRMFGLMAHEVGHYYWAGTAAWIAEGGAHLMSSVVTHKLQGSLLSPPCTLTKTITEFEELPYDPTSFDYLDCWYGLGERLFRDLHRSLDETAFRQAMRRLYLHIVHDLSNECAGDKAICYVREAFDEYFPEDRELVGGIIDRWDDGAEPYDLSDIKEPVNPRIPAIGGQIVGASISLSAGGSPISALVRKKGQIGAIHVNLDYSWEADSSNEFLPVTIDTVYEDGLPLSRELVQLPLPLGKTSHTHSHWMNESEAYGAHWIVVRHGDQKIAQMPYELSLFSAPFKITGSIINADGEAEQRVLVVARQGTQEFTITGGNVNGDFYIRVPAGTFTLEIHAFSHQRNLRFVGWYDGAGGITTDPSKAFNAVVNDSDFEGVHLVTSGNSEDLVCASGENRSRESGLCGGSRAQGTISDSSGQPLADTGMWFKDGEEVHSTATNSDGTFTLAIPLGTYKMEVSAWVGSEYFFLGWYDGEGSITTNPDEIHQIEVMDDSFITINITLPDSLENMLCPSGGHRSTATGECYKN